MSTRKAPPAPIQTPSAADKGKGRARPQVSRTPSRADHAPARDDEDDDAPPTSTLRARNVTGTTMLEFPVSPATPRSGGSNGNVPITGGSASGMAGAWKLPGVKGTMGGIASPGRNSPAAWSPATWAAEKNGNDNQRQRPPLTFRTDHTMKSCLDTLPLESKNELKRLFGIA